MANTKMGIKLEAENEKQFKSALAQINQEFKTLSAQAEATASAYDSNDKSVKALTTRNEGLEQSIEKQREKLELMNKALENASESYGENDKRTLKWKEQIAKTETAINKMTKEVDENNKSIDKQKGVINGAKAKYNELKEKAEDLKEKHHVLAKSMEVVSKSAKGLASGGLKLIGTAAKGAVAGVAAVGTAAIAAGKAIYGMAKDAADAGDAIDKGSQKMGVSAETYQILAFEAERSGTSINALQTAANKLSKAGSDLNVDEAIKKIASIKDPTERSAAAVDMFGAKTANELAPLLNSGTAGLKEMENAARSAGMVMSNDAVSASAQFEDSLTNLQTSFSGIKNNIMSELLPGMTEFVDGLTGMLTGEEGAEKKILDGAESMIDSIGSILPKFEKILFRLLDVGVEVAPKIIVSLADGMIDNLDGIIDGALKIVSTLTQGLLTEENIKKIMSAAVSLLTKLTVFLTDNVELIIDSAFLLIDGLVDGLLEEDNMKKLVEASIDVVGKIATSLIDNIPTLLESAGDLCKALFDAIKDYDWWALAKSVFESLKNGIRNLWNMATGGGGGADPQGSYAGGLPYVPYDGFVAELHKGERVLTAEESRTYSDGKGKSVNVTLHIENFNNNNAQDINRLADELSVVLAAKINRREAAFA